MEDLKGPENTNVNQHKKIWYMIAYKTTIPQRPNDEEVKNYK